MVGRIPAFKSCGKSSIPGEVRDFNLLRILCLLPCFNIGEDPNIPLTAILGRPALVILSNVLVHGLYSSYRREREREGEGERGREREGGRERKGERDRWRER